MNAILVIFQLVVILYSIILHEVSHGFAALKLGDDTAKRMGRLTLNPLKHLDPVGSVFLPVFLYLTTQGKFVFGWAKPVPYNPMFLKNPRRDSAFLALAGPLANFSLALIFGLPLRLINYWPVLSMLIPFFSIIVFYNLILAIFNLIPIPPLDGSKILFYFLRVSYQTEAILESYSWLFILLFFIFGFSFLGVPVSWLFRLITGLSY